VLGRVTGLSHPNGASTSTDYSGTAGVGAFAKVTLPANASGLSETKSTQMNMLGQVLTITDAYGSTLTNTYDGSGNVITVTRKDRNGANPHTVTMKYDDLGRKTLLQDPDLLDTWNYSYNALGEQVMQHSSSTCSKTFYDGQGRVISKASYASGTCSGIPDSSATWSFDTTASG